MKYLSDYMEKAQTQLFNELGVFFAFSGKQFEEGKKKIDHLFKKEDRICDCGYGMFCISRNAKKLMEGLEKIHSDAVKQDIMENGVRNIIIRELGNHECWYTGDISDAVEKLKPYGVEKQQIKQIFYEEYQNQTL